MLKRANQGDNHHHHRHHRKEVESQSQPQPQPQPQQGKSKRAIKLTELGPRLNMSLIKIEEGLIGSSKTIYHSSIQKLRMKLNH